MKLIEGMKKLKVIEKTIAKQTEQINDYAAIVSTERPHFGTEEAQRKEVASLIQSNMDLGKDYLALKRRVDLTNIQTRVTVGKDTYTIADLLQIRRSIGKFMEGTYKALNDQKAERRLGAAKMQAVDKSTPYVERMYNEIDKNNGLKTWQDLADEIEVRLEVINATTELVD